jgi:predicted transcriptional regulator
MTSQYLKEKYLVLKAVSQGCDSFEDIVWYSDLIHIRVRGILKYLMTRNDIVKYSQRPSRYQLTEKGLGKLRHWEKTKKL